MKKALLVLFALFTSFIVSAQYGPFNNIVEGDIYDPVEMIPVDFDMDGDIDFLVRSDHYIYWNENLGLGSFSYAVTIALVEGITDFDVVDYDMDGDYDVIVSADYESGLIRNLGDGSFEHETMFELAESEFIKATDFDEDGDPDLVGTSAGAIYWYEGDGTGDIVDTHEIEPGAFDILDFILSDVDGDSDEDIIWCGFSGGGEVYFIENLGGGEFDDRVIVNSGTTYASSVCTADIDGDDDEDIVHGAWTFEEGGKIYWNENMGDGTFSGPTLITEDYSGENRVISGDIDLDGDIDLVTASYSDSKVEWFENNGDATFEEPTIMANDIAYVNDIHLGDFDGDGDLDAYAVGIFPGKVGWFENGALNPNHAAGQIYYDENENGIMDDTEVGLPWMLIKTDPDGTMAVTYADGSYAVSFAGLPDDVYEVYPEFDSWGITSEYESYDVTVDADFTYIDTLDFGMFPTEGIDSIETAIVGSPSIRCNATRPIWISIKNLGTTLPSGIMELELDDSLTFEWAAIVPDSIVGQKLFWSYEDFFFFETESFMVHVGTPDGVNDTVTSILTSTIIWDDEVVFTAIDEITQPIDCAYDPNDKTPDPLGEGPEGNIPPTTEWIEYTVRFQNTGTDYAEDVIIRDQLDDNLIWTSIQPLYSSHDMEFEFDPSGEVAFVFNDIMLPDSNANEMESHGFVKYRIKLKPELAIGETIENTAHIYFDFNPAVITNTAINTIAEPLDVSIPLKDNIISVMVYPNPADDFVYVNLNAEKELGYTIRLYNLMGQEIFEQEKLNMGQSVINTSQFVGGLYFLEIESIEDGEQLYTTKLIIE